MSISTRLISDRAKAGYAIAHFRVVDGRSIFGIHKERRRVKLFPQLWAEALISAPWPVFERVTWLNLREYNRLYERRKPKKMAGLCLGRMYVEENIAK